MKAVSSISFFRQTQTLDCTLMQMEQSDLPLILQFQQKTFDAVEDKDTFVPLSEQEWRDVEEIVKKQVPDFQVAEN